jgi:hypothetical protein
MLSFMITGKLVSVVFMSLFVSQNKQADIFIQIHSMTLELPSFKKKTKLHGP